VLLPPIKMINTFFVKAARDRMQIWRGIVMSENLVL
jgi:hypothetical protein